MLKGVFCLFMVMRDLHIRTSKEEDVEQSSGSSAGGSSSEKREESHPNSVSSVTRRLALTSAPMAVPAIIFLAMNLLSFVSLRRISASAFTLIQQSKLIFTAVLSRLILGKSISQVRWRALFTLLCAVLIICYETRPAPPPDCIARAASVAGGRRGLVESAGTPPPGPEGKELQQAAGLDEEMRELSAARKAADYLLGVSAVALEAALSGFSNVYFERVLKSTSLSVWERNVQLAGYSLLIYVPMALSVHPNLLHGWSALTWLTAFLGALGGILIGLVINFMDSISKNLALTVAIVLTAALDYLLVDGIMNLPIVSAAGIVVTSIVTYSSG